MENHFSSILLMWSDVFSWLSSEGSVVFSWWSSEGSVVFSWWSSEGSVVSSGVSWGGSDWSSGVSSGGAEGSSNVSSEGSDETSKGSHVSSKWIDVDALSSVGSLWGAAVSTLATGGAGGGLLVGVVGVVTTGVALTHA